MRVRTVLKGLAALLLVAIGLGALAIARGPMSFGEFFSMLRLGIRASLQEEPDYDRVEGAVVETGRPAAEPRADGGDSALPAPAWTDFRGPGRLGIYTETPIRTEWPVGGLPLVWRRPTGAAYGSLTVAHGLVFSLEQRREQETLVAYGLDTGEEVWTAAWPGRFHESTSGEGPRATPVWTASPDAPDGAGLVLALGATGELHTFDARTGAPGWSLDLLGQGRTSPADAPVQADNLLYGLAASPLVHRGLVIVPTGAPTDGEGCLLALDLTSGALVWRAVREAAAYASPLVAELGGVEQIVFTSGTRATGIDPESGAELWRHPWHVAAELTCSQPIAVDDRHLLLTAGYGKGSALIRVERAGEGWTTEEVWRSVRFKPRLNPPVLYEGHVYGLDEGVLACLDPLTGKLAWKDGRYGLGQLLLADGHLLILDEDGGLALVAASPEGRDERARFQAIEGLTMSIPAAAHGRLLVRNKLELACFELAPPARPER